MTESSARLPVRTIGIDLGNEKAAFCILDQDGTALQEGSGPTERGALV
jgi:hypothetical protein